ncbi:hypothetical protein E4U12_007359 [Claviceps purpurea]|nr:hypothetical protein E4U12_007359 [Claviceps purpurea]
MNARAAIRDATLVSARVFKALAEGAHRREETIQLFLVHRGYQQDSGRVPESKQPKTLTEIRTELPHQIHPDNALAFLEERPLQKCKPHAQPHANAYGIVAPPSHDLVTRGLRSGVIENL